MTSLNYRHGSNLSDDCKSQNIVKTQTMSLNHKHYKNSNEEYKA